MAGIKTFEEGKALDQALVAFWHSGYEGTSFSDIEAATGLNKSSLYNAFGNKQSLYQKCLDRFEEIYETAMLDGLNGPGLRAVLGAYFESLFAHFGESNIPCGSISIVGALSTGRQKNGDDAFAKAQLKRLMGLLKQRFDKAVIEKELPENTDTYAMASLFFVISRGLAVLHDGDKELKILRSAFSAAMAVLTNPPLLDPHLNT